jgi:hypothetical protein
MHEFEVLLILCGSAAGHLVYPLAHVALVQSPNAVKRGEKLVVPVEARRWNKAAHGEGIDESVIEVLIGRGDISGELGCRNQVPFARRLGKLKGDRVYAKAIFAGIADEALGVDRAGKVDVQVGPLRKLRQKGVQCRRSGMRGGQESAGCAGFGLRNAGRRFRAGCGEAGEAGEKAD